MKAIEAPRYKLSTLIRLSSPRDAVLQSVLSKIKASIGIRSSGTILLQLPSFRPSSISWGSLGFCCVDERCTERLKWHVLFWDDRTVLVPISSLSFLSGSTTCRMFLTPVDSGKDTLKRRDYARSWSRSVVLLLWVGAFCYTITIWSWWFVIYSWAETVTV